MYSTGAIATALVVVLVLIQVQLEVLRRVVSHGSYSFFHFQFPEGDGAGTSVTNGGYIR